MAEMKMSELKVAMSIEPWATEVINGVLEAVSKGMKAGMPDDVAKEIAKEVARLVYSRAMKVEMPRGLC